MGLTFEERPPYIGVIGAGEATAEQIAHAEEVGRLLAREGVVLVCGGLGGVMQAAARGCENEGGTSIGLLPGDDRSDGSPHLTVAVATGLGEARNALIARTVDAAIAIGGGYGTLSEIGLVAKMGKTVVGLGTWELRDPAGKLLRATTPDRAVRMALEAAPEGHPHRRPGLGQE
jgi:uncharacterized protein (TIGR00725 family)